MAQEAAAVVGLVKEAARQTRLTARNLDAWEIVGDLNTALQELAASVKNNAQVQPLKATDTASLPVSTPVAVQLYRIAQEAVRESNERA